MNDIYVNIPSLNDREYVNTIKRMFDTADDPDNIYVGSSIFWKKDDLGNNHGAFLLEIEKELSNFSNVSFDVLSWAKYPGVGYGRTESTKHFNNQKYFMSIDPHTVFSQGWDSKAKEHYHESEKEFGKKRIITCYLPGAARKNDSETNNTLANYDADLYHLSYLHKWPIYTFNENAFPFQMTGHNFPCPSDVPIKDDSEIFQDNKLYYPANKINANFYFTESDPWVTEYNICLDNRIVFWLEEFYQSSISYSLGYQFVFVKDIFMWHIYNNETSLEVKENVITKKEKVSPRSYPEFEKELSPEERKYIYEKYIKGNQGVMPQCIDNEIAIELFDKDFSDFPRSLSGYLKYCGVDLKTRKTKPWNKLAVPNVLYR